MLVYRLIQEAFRHEPLSGQGALLYGGRWNPKGLSLLYATESPALSLLEILVHINPSTIPRCHLIIIEIPDSMNVYAANELPVSWRATGGVQPMPSQTFLLPWLQKPDALTVSVPSAIIPIMANYLINPRHPLFSACRVISDDFFEIDQRLYDPFRRSV